MVESRRIYVLDFARDFLDRLSLDLVLTAWIAHWDHTATRRIRAL